MPDLLARAREKLEKRARLIAMSREMLDRVEAEERDGFTAEERAEYDKIEVDIDALRQSADALKKQAKDETELRQLENEPEPPDPSAEVVPPKIENVDPVERRTAVLASTEYHNAMDRWLRRGETPGITRRDLIVAGVEQRALEATDLEAGGYTVPSQQFVSQLIKAVDDQTFIRDRANVISVTSAQSLGAVSLDADPEDGTWTGEISSADEDTQMDFGARELVPERCAKFIKVSRKLLRSSALDIAGLVAQRLGYKFAITLEKAALTGNGANQPLGLFTAHASGIPTSRDVSTGNTTSSIMFDGLINALYSCKQQYQSSGVWLFHRDAVSQIRKLKDGDGRYVWEPSIVVNRPDAILGRPVLMSEYVPNTFTTGLYVGLFGDLNWYWLAISQEFTIQRLIELYALTAQDGFIANMEADGQPVLSEAFARVKLG